MPFGGPVPIALLVAMVTLEMAMVATSSAQLAQDHFLLMSLARTLVTVVLVRVEMALLQRRPREVKRRNMVGARLAGRRGGPAMSCKLT